MDVRAAHSESRRRRDEPGAVTGFVRREVCGNGCRPSKSPIEEALPPKEADIARLVAEGCTDTEIAERIFPSRRAVANHKSNVLGKLELRNRTEVARWIAARGMVTSHGFG